MSHLGSNKSKRRLLPVPSKEPITSSWLLLHMYHDNDPTAGRTY